MVLTGFVIGEYRIPELLKNVKIFLASALLREILRALENCLQNHPRRDIMEYIMKQEGSP